MKMSKEKTCDICNKPVRPWESITYIGRYNADEMIFNNTNNSRYKINMCLPCHQEFMRFVKHENTRYCKWTKHINNDGEMYWETECEGALRDDYNVYCPSCGGVIQC